MSLRHIGNLTFWNTNYSEKVYIDDPRYSLADEESISFVFDSSQTSFNKS